MWGIPFGVGYFAPPSTSEVSKTSEVDGGDWKA